MTLFETRGLRKAFGGLVAVDEPDITIESGELVGIIGPNGAGKTTFFNCVTGVLEPDAGTVSFAGDDVTGLPIHEIAQRGLIRTYQHTRELTTMSVKENLKLAAPDHPGEELGQAIRSPDSVADHEAAVERRADDLLEQFDLTHVADHYAGDLSGGQRKLLEIARALMLEPEMLMLDEPLAGVNPTLGKEIVEYIEALNDEGMTFLVIEHEIQTLAELVDRLIVLNEGSVLADGDPADVLDNDDVIAAYLGGTSGDTETAALGGES
ncbi:ABC transporter ATP-binding protein [Haloferax sp. YSMS24]|uniref:ABC transporter ATP-binding protein n=1 Tax=Haloferax sp. YSMS24 TaxID=3388425 RepID=UPI00398C882C